jgi:hypothetical protein
MDIPTKYPHLNQKYSSFPEAKQLRIAKIPRKYSTFKPALLQNKLKPYQARIFIYFCFLAKIQNENMEPAKCEFKKQNRNKGKNLAQALERI